MTGGPKPSQPILGVFGPSDIIFNVTKMDYYDQFFRWYGVSPGAPSTVRAECEIQPCLDASESGSIAEFLPAGLED